MAKNINLSLLNEFFESSPVDYAKYLINLKNTEEKKEFVIKAKNRISALKDNKKVSETEEKRKNADETLKIIKEILDCNKNAQIFFSVASEVDKEKSEPKAEKRIAERTKLRIEKIAKIERKEKNINNKLFDHYFGYSNLSNMRNRLIYVTGETKKNRVDTINKQLTKFKNSVKNVPKNDKLKSEENEKITDVVEKILKFGRQKQGQGLKN